MKHIGFTGTQRGMTARQKVVVEGLLSNEAVFVARHGDCVGADSDFHDIVRSLGSNTIVVHPCDIPNKRAYCRLEFTDLTKMVKPPLDRNKDIVETSDHMIACPGEKKMRVRSGTWSTVRYAQSVGVPVIIVFPDGTTART